MAHQQPYELIHDNLRTAMRFFGEASGKGDVCVMNGAVAFYAGLDYGVFNISMLDDTRLAEAGGGQEDFANRLNRCADYFDSRSSRWSFWLCEDCVPRSQRRKARASLTGLGLRLISEAPGMMAPGLNPPRRTLPAIQCLRVESQALRETFAGVISVTFDIPMAIAKQVYYPEHAWEGDYQGFVALVEGRPVAVVAIVSSPGALGIYSLATLPQERRNGYGEALLRTAVAMEQERRGPMPLVLQSTEAGQALYTRLGFRTAAQFSVYLTK